MHACVHVAPNSLVRMLFQCGKKMDEVGDTNIQEQAKVCDACCSSCC